MTRRRYVTVTADDKVELVELPRTGRRLWLLALITLLLLLTLSTCTATSTPGSSTSLSTLISSLTRGRLGGAAGTSNGGLKYGSGNTSTNGQPGGALITISPSPGPAGSPGPSGAPGAAGATGATGPRGDTATISLGTGAGAISACDSDVSVSLRSAYVAGEFVLQSITLSNVAATCNGLDFTLYLEDAARTTLLTMNVPHVTVTPDGLIALAANSSHQWTSTSGSNITIPSPALAYIAMELAS